MSGPSQGYNNTNDVESFTERLIRPRPRSRTMSVLTTSTSTTFRSMFEITRTLSSSPTVSSRPAIEEAYGSFVPVRSAAICLRDFANDHATIIPRSPKRRRRVTFKETSSDDDDEQPQLPCINRPFPTPPKKVYRSPPMSSSSHNRSPGVHPILAKLEKESKFCTQLVYCSTCGKPGHDYPRCGKCSVMWCSRTCRLVAGKRHVCPLIH